MRCVCGFTASIALASLFIALLQAQTIDQNRTTKTLTLYVDLVDCVDDERLLNVSASFTPYPAIFDLAEFAIWMGGIAEKNVGAKQFAQKISADDFVQNVSLMFSIDQSLSFFSPFVESFNNSYMLKFLPSSYLKNLHAFLLDENEKNMILAAGDFQNSRAIFATTILNILNSILPSQRYEIPLKIYYSNTTIASANFVVRIESEVIGTSSSRRNFEKSFVTPKIFTSTFNETLRECPPDSHEETESYDDSYCKCNEGHRSGPYCMLLCNLEQIEPELSECAIDYQGRDTCILTKLTYVTKCLNVTNKALLSEYISAEAESLTNVKIEWKLTNILPMDSYFVKVAFRDQSGAPIGYFVEETENYWRLKDQLNVTQLDGIINAENEVCNGLLKMKPFKNHTVHLSIKSATYRGREKEEIDFFDIGTAEFYSPEVIPRPPFISKTTINGTFIVIEWEIRENDCPGNISQYEVGVQCSSTGQAELHNGSFDTTLNCQENKTFSNIFVPFRKDCDGDDLYVKLRVATSAGFGEWTKASQVPPLPMSAISWWLIVLTVLISLTLITLIFAVAFAYYYKKYVKRYIDAHKMFKRLFRRSPPSPPPYHDSANHRESGMETEFATTPRSIDGSIVSYVGEGSIRNSGVGSIVLYEESNFLSLPVAQLTTSNSSASGYATPITIQP